MPARPARFRAALLGLALTWALTACAGTGSPAAAVSGSSSAAPSPSAGTPAAATTQGQRLEVRVAGGAVSGDTGRVPVAAGKQVTLVVTSDVADEVHVHGYDRTAQLTPGTPAEIAFTADIPGVFEVELHEAGTVLLSLQVG